MPTHKRAIAAERRPTVFNNTRKNTNFTNIVRRYPTRNYIPEGDIVPLLLLSRSAGRFNNNTAQGF